MDRYVCIHGHFYQPPRENPWLEAIELQDSAYPYHDWNERIMAECYAPNAVSRILDGRAYIAQILNNYARISFNVGPSLLSWMKDKTPELYQHILDADKESQHRFNGHGSAIAQCYNHMIMPLANTCDKYTQVRWAVRDFEHRFGRPPEGMWLPETAVDLETLGILAELGIRFTILSPYQAGRVRKIGEREWIVAGGGHIDPTRAYRANLAGQRSIALFFYDGPISRAVAFEGLLNNGETFAQRILTGFSDERDWPQLVHIATDGESYGHHHAHGEMALSYALDFIESKGLAKITNYGEYLEKFPPAHEVEIVENTAWSCAHGVERWRSNCGCSTGGASGWTQEWRKPLRDALDWLRDTLAKLYEEQAARFLREPWSARDDYISVVLDRHADNVGAFLKKHSIRELSEEESIETLKLLEIQRHAMLMYTSCGWFFTELSGIESVQIIQYAGRAIQLAEEFTADPIEPEFLNRLAAAKSNVSEHGDGRRIYEKFVRPAMIDLPKVGAHYAISSLFEDYPDRTRVYSFTVERSDYEAREAGATRLAVGQARIISEITLESELLSFGVLHFGDHNLTGGVRRFRDDDQYQEMRRDLIEAFGRADLPETFRIIERGFEGKTYSLKQLFRDQQRKILDQILGATLRETEAVYRQIYERNIPLMRFLSDLGIPFPGAFQTAAGFALNSHLRQAMSDPEMDYDRVRALLEEARLAKTALDAATLEFTLRRSIETIAGIVKFEPDNLEAVARLDSAVGLARTLPFEVSLWIPQNICYQVWHELGPGFVDRAGKGEEDAQSWLEHMRSLGQGLRIRMD